MCVAPARRIGVSSKERLDKADHTMAAVGIQPRGWNKDHVRPSVQS